MIYALITTIISSFSNVFGKKSLSYSVRSRAHEISSYPIPLILLTYFMLTSFDLVDFNINLLLIVILIIIIDTIKLPISQGIYREEKISVIMPYLNLNKIFVIVCSFFIFQDVSATALWITIFTIGVIIVGSINFKTLTLPRNLKKILFVEVFASIAVLLSGTLVIKYGETAFFNAYVLLAFISAFLLLLITRQTIDLKHAKRDYWKHRTMGSTGWFSWFLSLVIINNLGLSISILLGFIGVGITLLFSYIFLKDTPSKKDIGLTIIVMILVGTGYYFK